jgi:putative hemolysin
MAWREQRKVTAALTLHCNKAVFILEPTEFSRSLAGKRVDVCEHPDGRLDIRHGEHALPYAISTRSAR